MDGGQGFLKVAMILLPKIAEKSPGKDPSTPPLNKKPSKEQEPKHGGVKQIITLFMGQKIPENYENVKRVLDCLNINIEETVETTFSSDLKLINLMLGLQSHASSYCCPYCTILTRSEDAYKVPGMSRSLKSIKEDYDGFLHAGGNPERHAKYFHSVIHAPLLMAPEDVEILLLIPPPGNS